MGWIYIITNNVNGKKYIGQTRQKNPRSRWRQHCSDPRGLLKTAIDKYGKINFEFKLLVEVPNEDLNNREQEEIIKNNTLSPHGYNLHKGGDCYEVHPETIQKQKLLWGPNHPLWNQRHSEETKQKISEATRGQKNPMYGKKHTPEVLRNLSLNNHMNGKTGGEAPIAKKVDAYSLEGEFLQAFDCIKDAAESIGRSQNGISNCIHGRAKTSGGFIWKLNKECIDTVNNDEPV